MKVFVSWSIAYDCIMDFHDEFKNHIMPEKLHVLSVSFFVPTFKKEKWWTSHNIAYNMWLLGEKAILYGAVWQDFIVDNDIIDYSYLHYSKERVTAFCYIITDQNNSQITAFHPWAMIEASHKPVLDISEPLSYAMISPNDAKAMLENLKDCHSLWAKTFFDPGQQITAISKEQMLESIGFSNYLIVNDYEYSLFKDKTWLSESEIINSYEKVIITLGANWVKIIDKNSEIVIPAIRVENVADPTWAWDALRWGLLKGLNSWKDWETSMKMWMLCAWYCIQQHWTQKHYFTKEEFVDKFEEIWWEKINL